MRNEIRSAAFFLSDLLRLGHGVSLTDHQLDTFRGTLEDLLIGHYQHHWFPEMPTRGSGFRCIRINHKMDPLLAAAAKSCGVNDSSLLRNMLPAELTLWIDPKEVSYRIGENGSICVIFDGIIKASNTNITTNSTLSSSSPSSSSSSTSSTTSTSPRHHHNNNNHHHHGSPNKNSSSSPNNYHHNNHHVQHNNHHNYHPGGHPGQFDRYATCKESVRGMDHLMIDNRNMSMDHQFATYVSS